MWLPIGSGCTKKETAPLSSNVGTSATVQLPEIGMPMLTKVVADRIQPAMAQADALAVLQEASASNSLINAAVNQGKLNNIRYDLTVTQGKRKLVLHFKDNKLVEKSQEGLE
jgi:hypothetical protein